MSYFNFSWSTFFTQGIFWHHTPIIEAAFLEIMKNTFYKFDVLLYREQGHIIIFSVFLLVVSENRKTQFFLTHPVHIFQTTSWPKWCRPFRLIANFYLFFCKDLAVFIFPTLLADFKDIIQDRDRVQSQWA